MCRFLVFLMLAVCPLVAQVSYEDLLKGPGENWLTYAGNYSATRHSPLKQITRDNVNRLTPAWTYHVLDSKRLTSVPLVYEALMYVTNSNEIHALDAQTGRRIWQYRDDRVERQPPNRGAAILGDRVFFVTGDCYLTALERQTGALLYAYKYADIQQGYHCTLAPLTIKYKIILGVAGGDSGMRGFVSAHDPANGKELWRFWTIPERGQPGSETWSDQLLAWGGAATWMTGSYDPELNLLYWATGNPWPDFYGGDRKGDNLYSDAVVALDADTGKMKWYFQFTPHDTHDWDAQAFLVLVDKEWKGKPRKLLLQANRNGFFYVLDRVTGEYLNATQFIDEQNWAKGIDSKGRPIEIPNMDPIPGGVRVCPSVRGAANWMSPSYNPATGLFYFPALEMCDIYFSSAKEPEPMKGFAGTGGEHIPTEPGQFFLRALDPLTGKRVWQYPMTGDTTSWAGTVSTEGGVIFFGDDDGHLVAVDARDGGHLWHYNMGQRITASPMTYMVDGKQFVAITTATDVFAFKLFEPVQPVPVPQGTSKTPAAK